ncbi:solute carrier family 25 member 43 isoform X2 [Nannospalax galili]|uniref:solute carrier family 25 member 43 isoform X2 n=1 Tax=Nannospalax galili TaxID=1026970 RepID=UPI000819CA14|nr:solute carrier family 25 member 43 isoform X2 [Nannospalax galili]
MATWRRDGRLTGSQRLLCAGLAGALSLSLTAPLELATVLAQVGFARGHARGPWAIVPRVWVAEGPRALWKGNAVACLRLLPCSTVQLTAYRKFVVLFTDDLGHISQWSSIMAGSLAGMVSTIVTYPTDLIKTRLIVQNMLEPSYRGLIHAFTTIYQQEGFLALYRGLSLTILGAVPFSAGSLLVYMNLEKIWNGPRDHLSHLQNFANVCVAAAVSQTLSFPFDAVKRKMQAFSMELPNMKQINSRCLVDRQVDREFFSAPTLAGVFVYVPSCPNRLLSKHTCTHQSVCLMPHQAGTLLNLNDNNQKSCLTT